MSNRIDLVNIGLIIFSFVLAFFIPFEMFLFAYGVLGPLHYLTEISWLHDKNYYATDKRDVILLILISFLLTVLFIGTKHFPEIIESIIPNNKYGSVVGHLTFIAFGSSLFFAFIRKPLIKLIGIVLMILLTIVSDHIIVFLTVFLPTLVHVFVFTSLFMLYGALKQRSAAGYLSVFIHLLCPFLLYYLFPAQNISSAMGIDMYVKSEFAGLNQFIYGSYFNEAAPGTMSKETFMSMAFNSKAGIAIMRFVAYAYTYHYLNWFSKTEVIKWHKMPKPRLIFILICWIISVTLYAVDYSLGFQWLFLLSFMHVLLEFPLNYISFVGIFREISSIFRLSPAN